MYVEPPPQIEEIELQPVHAKGELVVDNWWQPPEAEAQSFWRRHWLKIITLAIPIAVTAIYLVFIASNQYVSEARFMVRGPSASDSFSLASLINDQKVTRASDETYAVSEYLVSRDAMNTLFKNADLAGLFSREQADIFSRFPNFYSRKPAKRASNTSKSSWTLRSTSSPASPLCARARSRQTTHWRSTPL